MSKQENGAATVLARINELDRAVPWEARPGSAEETEREHICGKINALTFAMRAFGYPVRFDKSAGVWVVE